MDFWKVVLNVWNKQPTETSKENYFLRREADIKPINLWISRFFTEQLQEYTSQGASFSNENLYSLVNWIE